MIRIIAVAEDGTSVVVVPLSCETVFGIVMGWPLKLGYVLTVYMLKVPV